MRERSSRIFISLKEKRGQTPKSGIPPNIAPKVVTPESYVQVCDYYATLIGQFATITTFGAILCGIPLSGAYPKEKVVYVSVSSVFLEMKSDYIHENRKKEGHR